MDLTTARPYAKAIFALALRDQQFSEWQNALITLAMAITEHKLDLFYDASKNFPAVINLVRLLAERKKLEILPNIAFGYKQLVLEHEKILEVKIIATCELSAEQKERLLAALRKRYQRQILLQCQVDNKLIGGAVIYIAGQVIDGSIKGALQRLKQNLC